MAVSVVLPNYNRARLLRRYLPGVLAMAQGHAGQTEVIVVDDGSTDESVTGPSTGADGSR